MRSIILSVFPFLFFFTSLPFIVSAEESVLEASSEVMPTISTPADQEEPFSPSLEGEVAGNPDVWVAEGDRATFTTPEGEVTYEYRDVNGLAVAEGDIILGSIEDFQEADYGGIRSRGLITTRQMGKDWPNGIVPYAIAKGFTDPSLVAKAIEEYHKKTSLRFVRRTTQKDYIRYVKQAKFLASMSPIGRQGGRQDVKINFFFLGSGERIDDNNMVTTIVHETAHSLGMKHEQSRSDREQFLEFDLDCEWDNRFFYEITGNFATAPDFQRVGTYDFDSVMQYPSIPGTKKDTGTDCDYFFRKDNGRPIRGGTELSEGDIRTLGQRYGRFRTNSVTTPAGGGGGKSFTVNCPSNRVLVGIRGRAHAWIDGIQGICVKVNYDGSWSGRTSNTGYKGGTGGRTFSRLCPRGRALSGISGRAGTFVDQITIYCKNLVNANQAGLVKAGRLTGTRVGVPIVGGGGGKAFGRYNCLDNMPGRGLSGRSGRYLDRIQLRCQVGSTLPAQPALSSPQQHANLGGTRRPVLHYSSGYKATEWIVMVCPANANSGYCRSGASTTIRFAGGATGTSLPRDLRAGQYKWHVTAKNGVGEVKSAIRRFSILPGPRVVIRMAEAGKLCRGTSKNVVSARVLNDGLGGTSQTVKVSLYWATFDPEIGYVPSGAPLKTVDIGGLRKDQSKTAIFKTVRLPSAPRSIDVLLIQTVYPDGLLREKQAVLNVGQYLDSYRNCLAQYKSTKLSGYPTYYQTLGR